MNKIAVVLSLCTMLLNLGQAADALTLAGGVSKSGGDSEVGRIGVRISWTGRVDRVLSGSPAANAGLLKDDKVKSVDGRPYKPGRISGQPGTSVLLDVKRSRQSFQVAVERVEVSELYY